MSDLISRQAAIDALNEYFARIGKLKRRGLTQGEKAISLDTVGAIKTLPSAEPVRHGKNIGTDYDEVDQFVCSECGIELQDWHRVERDDYDGEETYHEYRLRYCPNCGADMRGEINE